MADKHYYYQKPVHRSHYSQFRSRLKAILIILVLFTGLVVFIISGLRGSQEPLPKSGIENQTVTDSRQTFTSPYFKFQDIGKWVLDQKASMANKYVYIKYRGQVIEGRLAVYVNQVPIPLYLAVSRVLPVRVVNNDSFQVTGISDPCTNRYRAGELHKIKEVSINGAGMLCDPDTADYSAVISQIDGNYRLHLKRRNGQLVQFVITYLNQSLEPRADSLLNIASSFQAR